MDARSEMLGSRATQARSAMQELHGVSTDLNASSYNNYCLYKKKRPVSKLNLILFLRNY